MSTPGNLRLEEKLQLLAKYSVPERDNAVESRETMACNGAVLHPNP